MFDRLVEFLIESLDSLRFFTIVYAYERGILLRWGVFKRELEPGLHWYWPLHIDYVHKENVVPRTERLPSLATTTKDGRSIGFDAVVTYCIADIRVAVLEVECMKDAISDSCAGVIGTELSNATWEDIWHGNATDKLTSVCRRRAKKYGVEIQQVQLAGIALVKNLRITVSGQHGEGVTTMHFAAR